jgi:hypothetical protein
MSRLSVRHTPAALCLFVIALCLQASYAISESSTQAVLNKTVVSAGVCTQLQRHTCKRVKFNCRPRSLAFCSRAGFTARRLLQDAEMNVASSDDELWEQPEGLTEVSSQSDKTDFASEAVSEATTSADQFDMDPSGESGEQKQVVCGLHCRCL